MNGFRIDLIYLAQAGRLCQSYSTGFRHKELRLDIISIINVRKAEDSYIKFLYVRKSPKTLHKDEKFHACQIKKSRVQRLFCLLEMRVDQ